MNRKSAFQLICIVAVLALSFVVVSNASAVTIFLDDIPTTPTDSYRWLDVANQAYSGTYQSSYDYTHPFPCVETQPCVEVVYDAISNTLHGTLIATNLKPNFAYQMKLAGDPGSDPDANERIGLAGRWWREEWNGTTWTNGQNLNNKGDGYTSPNDTIYFDTKDEPYTGGGNPSPTGLRYRYTGYLVFDYFITDKNGDATFSFIADSSYHVLWATNDSDGNDGRGHRDWSSNDGPLKTTTFDVDPLLSPAYDTDYDEAFVSIFGEWERLPVGGIFLQPGDYVAEIILTEESFHGSGGTYAGNWAAAMGANIQFFITFPSDFDADCDVDGSDLAVFAADFGRTDCGNAPPCKGDFDTDGSVDGTDLFAFALNFGRTVCP